MYKVLRIKSGAAALRQAMVRIGILGVWFAVEMVVMAVPSALADAVEKPADALGDESMTSLTQEDSLSRVDSDWPTLAASRSENLTLESAPTGGQRDGKGTRSTAIV